MELLRFIDPNSPPPVEIEGSYEPLLVLLSVFIAVLSSYVAISLSNSDTGQEDSSKYYLWLVTGGVAQGLGIWAMHFIAMLAYSMPIDVNYDPILTSISVVPAILASMVVLSATSQPVSKMSMLLRSVLMGSGIGAMHYTGMAAMKMNADMSYDFQLFVLSIVVAVMLSFVSLGIKMRATNHRFYHDSPKYNVIGSAVCMGLAISAMHYTAMSATVIFPANQAVIIEEAVSSEFLALVIAGVMFVIISLMIVAARIGQRLNLVALLEESEERYRSIIDNSGDGIITIDGKGVIESFNPAAEKIFGYMAGEVIGRDVSVLLHEDERPAHLGYISRSKLDASRVINGSHVLKGCRKSGELIPVELNVTAMHLRGVLRYVGVIRDISERMKVEKALQDARFEAERANSAKSEFLARMSHELRTPLNAILGFGQLLQMDASSRREERCEEIEHIMEAGNHLLNLVNEVLDIAKIDANKIEFTIEEIGLCEAIENAVLLIRPLAEEKEITIKGVWGGSACVRADVLRLKQILINLLSNAVKYNRAGGSIMITVDDSRQARTRINISDTGVGIERDKQQEVFEPFKQIQGENGNLEGTGIGLSITKKLVNAMDGEIGVESDYGKGSTFWFELPRCEPVVGEE